MSGTFLLQGVDEEAFKAFSEALADSEGTFYLEMASGGGDTDVMWAFHDRILCSKRKIVGTALGFCYSASPLILAVCDVSLCTPKTTFMVHEDKVKVRGSPLSAEAAVHRAHKDEEKWYSAMEYVSGTSSEIWRAMSRRGDYFDAPIALKLGIVDRILPFDRGRKK